MLPLTPVRGQLLIFLIFVVNTVASVFAFIDLVVSLQPVAMFQVRDLCALRPSWS